MTLREVIEQLDRHLTEDLTLLTDWLEENTTHRHDYFLERRLLLDLLSAELSLCQIEEQLWGDLMDYEISMGDDL